jgi:hypothetical protein
VWLGYAGWRQWQQQRMSALILLAGAIMAWVLCGLYLLGWQRNPGHPVSPGMKQSLWSFINVLSLASGHVNTPHRIPYAAAVAVALIVSAVIGVRVVCCRPEERLRAAGLLAVLVGVFCMALAIGHARTWYAETGSFGLHYVLVMSPLLVAAYLIVALYASPRAAPALQGAVFLLLVISAWHNYAPGEKSGHDMKQIVRAIEVEIRAGVPPEQVAKKCLAIHPTPPMVAAGLQSLQQAQMGPYKRHAAFKPDRHHANRR